MPDDRYNIIAVVNGVEIKLNKSPLNEIESIEFMEELRTSTSLNIKIIDEIYMRKVKNK